MELHFEHWVRRSKANLLATFWGSYFLTGYPNTSWLVFLPTLYAGCFMYPFCYQCLMIVRCFGIFLLDRTRFFTFIIPGRRDIMQIVKTVQIDLHKFCFTEPGSNFAFILKNIAHNYGKLFCILSFVRYIGQ